MLATIAQNSTTSTTALPTVSLFRRVRTHAAVKVSALLFLFIGLLGGTANATTPADPLGGAGSDLVDSMLQNFKLYVIPVVGGIILAVVAFKLIVKLGTRFMNRA